MHLCETSKPQKKCVTYTIKPRPVKSDSKKRANERNWSQIISGAIDLYLVCGGHVTAGGRSRDHVYTVMRLL